MQNSRHMIIGGFWVMWDILYKYDMLAIEVKQMCLCIIYL